MVTLLFISLIILDVVIMFHTVLLFFITTLLIDRSSLDIVMFITVSLFYDSPTQLLIMDLTILVRIVLFNTNLLFFIIFLHSL